MMIPALMIELNELHSLLSKASRHEAVRRIGARSSRVFPVEFENVIRLAGDIGDIRDR